MYKWIQEQFKLDKQFPFAAFKTHDRQQFLHVHDCLELNIVERGEGHYIINGKKYPMCAGDIFVINNKEPHMAVHDENLELTVLIFDINLLWSSEGMSGFLTPFLSRKEQFSHRITGQSRNYDEMAELFGKIEQEYRARQSGWQIAVQSLLGYLLTLLYRCYEEKQELDKNRDDFQQMYARICAIFHYIEKHFTEKITLEQLAWEVSISQQYLCKCFRKVTGRTIFDYIEQMRLQYSCYLLRTTQESITEIAMESGFNTVSYFNRIFKKYKGCTPRQYRIQKENG